MVNKKGVFMCIILGIASFYIAVSLHAEFKVRTTYGKLEDLKVIRAGFLQTKKTYIQIDNKSLIKSLEVTNKFLNNITRNGEKSDFETLVNDFVDISKSEIEYTELFGKASAISYEVDDNNLEEYRKQVLQDNIIKMELIKKDKVEDQYIYTYEFQSTKKDFKDEIYGVYIDEGVKVDTFSITEDGIYAFRNGNKEKVESRYLDRYLFVLDFSKKNEGNIEVKFNNLEIADKYSSSVIEKVKDESIKRKKDRYEEYMEAYQKMQKKKRIRNEYESLNKED